MSSSFDILGLGCVAVDDFLYVGEYPAADSKVEVQRRERQCGGLTATALVAAARFGARCGYASILGNDELSRFVIDQLQQEGIDTQLIRLRAGARPIHSTVIVDKSRLTRTIFYDLHGVFGAQADWPEPEVIRSARVLFVDHFGIEGMIRAVRIAREAGIPVVADFENDQRPRFADLLELVDHLIISQSFATKLTGESDPVSALIRLWNANRQVVIVTCGERGCWYLSGDNAASPLHQPAFVVPVIDTTGCGDVFHGVYAAALAAGAPLTPRIRLAAAAAALKGMQHGGQAGIPKRSVIEAFLREHGP